LRFSRNAVFVVILFLMRIFLSFASASWQAVFSGSEISPPPVLLLHAAAAGKSAQIFAFRGPDRGEEE